MTDAMTDVQFDALAELVGLRSPKASTAARLVLVGRLTSGKAAVTAGCSPASVSNSLRRLRRSLRLAKIAAGASLS